MGITSGIILYTLQTAYVTQELDAALLHFSKEHLDAKLTQVSVAPHRRLTRIASAR
jgi:hypothetical protein